jgi:hypothetical protein
MVASQLVVVTIQVPPAHHQIFPKIFLVRISAFRSEVLHTNRSPATHADNFGTFQDLGSVLLFLVPYFRLAATDDPATDGPATGGPATDGPATGGPATDGPATGDIHMTQRQCDNDQLLPVPEEVEYITYRCSCSLLERISTPVDIFLWEIRRIVYCLVAPPQGPLV